MVGCRPHKIKLFTFLWKRSRWGDASMMRNTRFSSEHWLQRANAREVISSNNRDRRHKLRWLICPNMILSQTAASRVTRSEQTQDERCQKMVTRLHKRTRVASPHCPAVRTPPSRPQVQGATFTTTIRCCCCFAHARWCHCSRVRGYQWRQNYDRHV